MPISPFAKSWGRQKPPVGTPINLGHPLTRRLSAFYAFNEGGGGAAYDALGALSKLVFTNSPTWATGSDGRAIKFASGSSQYLVGGGNLSFDSTGFTISAIINTSTPTAAFQMICTNNSSSTDTTGFELRGNNTTGGISFFVPPESNTQNLNSVSVLSANKRYHIVGTANPATQTIYINGVKDASQAMPVTITIPANPIQVGRRVDGLYYSGVIEHIALWNRGLTAAEVAELYENPYGVFLSPSPTRFLSGGIAVYAVPLAPASLTATNAAAPVLTWASSAGASSYVVKRGTVNGGPYGTTVVSGLNALTYTDNSAVAGQTYYYVVDASNGSGNSPDSPQATAYTPPTAPPQLAGLSGNTKVTLKAGASAGGGTVTYNVYDGTTQGAESGTPVLTGLTNPAAMIVTSLTNGTKYFFYATAVNGAGKARTQTRLA